MEENNIFKFKDVKMVPDPFIDNKYASSTSTSCKSTSIVIDNGKSKNALIDLVKPALVITSTRKLLKLIGSKNSLNFRLLSMSNGMEFIRGYCRVV